MKKDPQLPSDSKDLISLSALLHEILTEERERLPRVGRSDRRPSEDHVCRASRPPESPPPTILPGTRLRLAPVSNTNRQAVV